MGRDHDRVNGVEVVRRTKEPGPCGKGSSTFDVTCTRVAGHSGRHQVDKNGQTFMWSDEPAEPTEEERDTEEELDEAALAELATLFRGPWGDWVRKMATGVLLADPSKIQISRGLHTEVPSRAPGPDREDDMVHFRCSRCQALGVAPSRPSPSVLVGCWKCGGALRPEDELKPKGPPETITVDVLFKGEGPHLEFVDVVVADTNQGIAAGEWVRNKACPEFSAIRLQVVKPGGA